MRMRASFIFDAGILRLRFWAVLFIVLLFTPNLVQITSATSTDSAKSETTSMPAFNFTSQIYNGTSPPPNDQIYNATNPYQHHSTPWDEVNETEGPITVDVLLAGDDEAQSTLYWICSAAFHSPVDWIKYTEWQIERGDDALTAKYGIDLRIRGAVTWTSTDGISDPDFLNEQMMNQTGWNNFFNYNGYEIDVLFGVVGQSMDVVAETYPEYLPGVYPSLLQKLYKNTILVNWQVYWADDNIVQHEFSHIFFTLDHIDASDPGYNEDCIMSYRFQDVYFLYEDRSIWVVFASVSTAVLSYNYCTTCNNRILSWKYHDINIDGKVNMKDIALASQAYGSSPGSSRWDPRADINWDGLVDILDVGIIARNYGLVIW